MIDLGNINGVIWFSLILAVINLAMVIVLAHVFVKTNRINKEIIKGHHLQTRYMDQNVDFCEKTRVMLDAIDMRLESEEESLRECNELLSYMHGGDSISEALIADKKYVSAENGIRFIDEIRRLPDAGQVDEVDLVSLLGNLLDNAIDGAAAEQNGEAWVKCSSDVVKGVWSLTVSNTKDPSVKLAGHYFQTTKPDQANHGLGVQIIRDIAGKYGGKVTYEDRGGEVTARVRMILRSRK